MEYLDKRVKVICDQLKKLMVKKIKPVENWRFKKGNFLRPMDAEKAPEPWEDFDSVRMHWYGPDEHYWFHTEYKVPYCLHETSMQLHVRTQIEEWDDAKNPQFLLFINGEIIQGLDMNHREVCLNQYAKAGEVLRIDLQAYTGTLHSEFNLIVSMQETDPAIEKFYYDLWVPLSAFPRMEPEDKNRLAMEEILNQAVNMLDLRTPYSDAFYATLKEADAWLWENLYEKRGGCEDVIATCIGHTHIDVAWWWTVEQTREKVARSFATVLKLMEEYPNYKFMSSQPQLYYFIKERYPELYTRIRDRIKEGRWEPEGGMWLEADCNLTSGESLIRQFLHGKRFFREEFGVENRILWLPDVFGYSGALPQIMKGCGIDYFMTTKLAWNQYNKIPYDTFYWRGIDGTKILSHLVTTLDVGQSTENFFTTYNGRLHPDSIMGGWTRYQNKNINNDILISYGYGDGGGGPTREMLETSIRMEQGVAGIPKVRQEFSRTYFEELNKRVKDHKRLPLWEGELYFEYHRGTYTSMARNKRSNRKSELMLMDIELMGVLAKEQIPYPVKELDRLWKTVLLNQFHDILPGSSIREVYEVTKEEYEEIAETGEKLLSERFLSLTEEKEGVTVFNTIGMDREDVVFLKDCSAKALADAEGNNYPLQQTEDGAVAYLGTLPSKGYKTFTLAEKFTEEPSQFTRQGDFMMETPFYKIVLNEQALFTSVYDKEEEREIIKEGEAGNLFRMYEDKPIYYDNWDIDVYYTEKYWDITELTHMEWTEIGRVRAVLSIERKFSSSLLRQNIIFYTKSRRIDFETWVDWKEHQHLLKVHFPVNIHTDEAAFDIQFGNLKRKVHENTSWDRARFESCGQKWMDLSEGHYGVSMLNDCKYGHSVKDSNMALTLIKSGIEPNPDTDVEEHVFTYAIYPHKGDFREGRTVQEAYCLNQPARAISGLAKEASFSLIRTDQPNVVLETVKAAEDGSGIIVRIYECDNALTKTRISLAHHILSVQECNMIEEEGRDLKAEGNEVELILKPYEIKTLRICYDVSQ